MRGKGVLRARDLRLSSKFEESHGVPEPGEHPSPFPRTSQALLVSSSRLE